MNIGIDIGGSHIAVGIVQDGKIISKSEIDINYSEILKIEDYIRDTLVSLINNVLTNCGKPNGKIEKIGIGFPSEVENNIINNNNKFNLVNYDLVSELRKIYHTDIYIENDATCAALAESKYGSLKNIKNGVFLCFGTGVGGVTIKDDKVTNSEYGHIMLDEVQETFENIASMKYFKNKVKEILEDEEIQSENILELLLNNKDNAKINYIIDIYIENMIVGILHIEKLLNSEAICLGGSFVYYKEILYKRLIQSMKLLGHEKIAKKIVLAKLNNDAGIIGASLL